MRIVQGFYILKNKIKSKNKLFIYIDGAARGNPGPAGIGVLLKDEDGTVIKEISRFLGEATNNIAEYNALIEALEEAGKSGYKDVQVCSDSELVILQLKGEYKVKNSNLKKLFDKAISLSNNFDKIEIKHIPREENKDADRLANKAINLSGLNNNFRVV